MLTRPGERGGYYKMIKHLKQFALLATALVVAPLSGKTQFLPLNEIGRCDVTEVVMAEGYSKSVLYANTLSWLKGLPHMNKVSVVEKDSIAGKISGNFEFLVYSQSGILQKVSGSVSYHFNIETREAKYRYSFTDFVFHYYAQDRNCLLYTSPSPRD